MARFTRSFYTRYLVKERNCFEEESLSRSSRFTRNIDGKPGASGAVKRRGTVESSNEQTQSRDK